MRSYKIRLKNIEINPVKKYAALFLSDPATWTLIAANIWVIYSISKSPGDALMNTLWIYWTESVGIGVLNALRMLSARNVTGEIKIGGRPLQGAHWAARAGLTGFFCFHYGFFHLVYAIFLGVGTTQMFHAQAADFNFVVSTAGFMMLHHVLLFVIQSVKQKDTPLNLGAQMMKPYVRIIPMHFTIIFGGFTGLAAGALMLFNIIKSSADLSIHAASLKRNNDKINSETAAG